MVLFSSLRNPHHSSSSSSSSSSTGNSNRGASQQCQQQEPQQEQCQHQPPPPQKKKTEQVEQSAHSPSSPSQSQSPWQLSPRNSNNIASRRKSAFCTSSMTTSTTGTGASGSGGTTGNRFAPLRLLRRSHFHRRSSSMPNMNMSPEDDVVVKRESSEKNKNVPVDPGVNVKGIKVPVGKHKAIQAEEEDASSSRETAESSHMSGYEVETTAEKNPLRKCHVPTTPQVQDDAPCCFKNTHTSSSKTASPEESDPIPVHIPAAATESSNNKEKKSQESLLFEHSYLFCGGACNPSTSLMTATTTTDTVATTHATSAFPFPRRILRFSVRNIHNQSHNTNHHHHHNRHPHPKQPSQQSKTPLSDDPTIHESIECVFASQLNQGIDLMMNQDEDDDDDDECADHDCVDHDVHSPPPHDHCVDDDTPLLQLPPSRLLQTRSASRSILPAPAPAVSGSSSEDVPRIRSSSLLSSSSYDRTFSHHHHPHHHHHRSQWDKDKETQSPQMHKQTSTTTHHRVLRESARLTHVGTYRPHGCRDASEECALLSVQEVRPPTPPTTTTLDPLHHTQKPKQTKKSTTTQKELHHHHDPHCKSDDTTKNQHGQVVLRLPYRPPHAWPQHPLLLRPSRGTRVTGVRFCHASEYLWQPGDAGTWHSALVALWNTTTTTTTSTAAQHQNHNKEQEDHGCCAYSCPLPINNGTEADALVTDFVTPFFEGTLLVRIRDSSGTTQCDETQEPPSSNIRSSNHKDYFAGMNRRYQAVVQGRFVQPINLVPCLTGFQLERPCGKLPARWLVQSALRVMHFFAPQLHAVIDSTLPSHALTPLGSTPQCVLMYPDNHNQHAVVDIDQVLEEPDSPNQTLLGTTGGGTTSVQRARFRKKHWDKLTRSHAVMNANVANIYVFEFLQHLFDFHNLQLDLGSLGSVSLQGILDGQPLNILALQNDNSTMPPLWSFDLWHEQLYHGALMHHQHQHPTTTTTTPTSTT